ncbi:hypothetical protein [Bradyrhizobium sp. USDA 336]|uniref:hypothetical protein n=1 Tax=Bradyrhizobium sp. USDA 336 TaxID=3156311 RepID=UPI003832CD3C
MKIKLAIAAFAVLGVAVLGYAYVRSYPPFTSQFVQTCENAIQERLTDPSTYQRIDLEDSRRRSRGTNFSPSRNGPYPSQPEDS